MIGGVKTYTALNNLYLNLRSNDTGCDYITVTGAEFNTQMAGIRMYKLLNSSMVHYDYKYEPNALNDLSKTGECFDPDPNCMPNGLYFCAESEILRWVSLAEDPLIALVEIPADALVSIGNYKFKTDKMILGEPIKFQEFYSDDYIRSMPLNYICIESRWSTSTEAILDIAKRQYTLNQEAYAKADNPVLYIEWLLIKAIWHGDIRFLDLMRCHSIVQDIFRDPQNDRAFELLCSMYRVEPNTIKWFETHFPQQTKLINSFKRKW